MVGSLASSSARNVENRFYNPPPLRRQLQQQQQQQSQQQSQQQQQRSVRPKARAAAGVGAAPAVEVREPDSKAESDDSSSKVSLSVSVSSSPSPPPRPPTTASNLDRFLEATTPAVRAQYFAKRSSRGWRHLYMYYTLSDLWDSFGEWSAYGAGVPLVLNGCDDVTQYYVPYLSGIQLYVNDPARPSLRTRHPCENGDGELYRDTSSEGSSECVADRRLDRLHEARESQKLSDQLNSLGLADKARGGLEGSSSDDGDAKKETGLLIYEYLERGPPYGREPLAAKVSSLARQFPDLNTYKSYDLLQSSWFSVAWYPIYRIPTGPTLRDLDACFLTFHSLATPLKNVRNGRPEIGSCSVRKVSGTTELSSRLPLPIFGLASYKFRESIWNHHGVEERQQASLLLQAADDWLQALQVEHPDFRFFMSHGIYRK